MALSDDRLREIKATRIVTHAEAVDATAELLAIRERAATVLDRPLTTVVDLCGSATQADSELAERVAALVAYGDGAQAPERRYSEAEVRSMGLEVELTGKWQSDRARDGFRAGLHEMLRRLRGEGEAKPPPCPGCREPLARSDIAPTRWQCRNEHCGRGHISAGEVGVDP